MALSNEQLGKLLLENNYVEKGDLDRATEQAHFKHIKLEDALIEMGIVTKDILGQAIAESFDLPYADLNTNIPNKEQILKIPEDVAKRGRVVLFKDSEREAIVTTDEPDLAKKEETALKELLKGKELQWAYSISEDINAIFVNYRKALDARFVRIINEQKRVAPEIVDEIIADALTFRASDIHFEPQEEELLIRFRVDGVLQEAGRIDKQYYDNILNRIKVLARLRTDEHNHMQDGAIRYKFGDQHVDLRISVAPTLDGEKVVIRLLAEYVRRFTLDDLGLRSSDREQVLASSRKPFGMILSVGPTGSGKTTTMYSVVKLLNQPDVSISTIEDPVEYKIPRVNHMQVNTHTEITFAKGLRSLARQDPDIILVGEIRDEETAEIAVNAALTGHLMLSTFHANDAATAIPRLLDMNVEPFLLASTLELIIAQRLIRKICEGCKHSYTDSVENLKAFVPNATELFHDDSVMLYKGKGCGVCNGTGYQGRLAVFELIQINREMQDLILQNPSVSKVRDLATASGSKTMFEDGIHKVMSGVTTIEEILRVVPPPRE